MQGEGTVVELMLVSGLPAARISCAPGLIPAPGRYVLAYAEGSLSPLATWLYAFRAKEDGFICASPAPPEWRPGNRLYMRGPLGCGFEPPAAAKRVALVAVGHTTARLLALVETALRGDASVTLVCDDAPEELPLQIEVQPMRALAEVCRWSDYAAFDVSRERLPELMKVLGEQPLSAVGGEAQVLVETPMPCGGLADCGVCTVRTRKGPVLACKDGPVFDLKLLALER